MTQKLDAVLAKDEELLFEEQPIQELFKQAITFRKRVSKLEKGAFTKALKATKSLATRSKQRKDNFLAVCKQSRVHSYEGNICTGELVSPKRKLRKKAEHAAVRQLVSEIIYSLPFNKCCTLKTPLDFEILWDSEARSL